MDHLTGPIKKTKDIWLGGLMASATVCGFPTTSDNVISLLIDWPKIRK